MVVGEGFEPSKSMTADLQSAPFWPLGNPTRGNSNFEVMLEMVVGEGLFVASLLTLRAVACGNVLSLSLESNLSRRFSPFPDECKLSQSHRSYHIAVVNYGGGGKDYSSLRSSPFGPLPVATFSRFRSNRTLVEGSHPSPMSANFHNLTEVTTSLW